MDPITQGALGAAATQALVGRRVGRRAWWLGAWGGMAADLDVLIRWPGDPMVALTFHRHFTHSLAFIPIGGLLCALPFLGRRWAQADRRGLLLATTIGYATHALLDAFTSYGTLLGWPFSDTRVAWNVISIIDPAYTIPLIVGVILTARRADIRFARWALALSSIYMALCGVQRSRVRAAQAQVLEARGHQPSERFTFPLFLTNRRWRSLYRVGDDFHADLYDVPWFGPVRILPGQTHPAFDREDAPPELDAVPAFHASFDTVAWFSSHRMTLDPIEGGHRLCDLRYSRQPEGFAPVFCWELLDNAEGPRVEQMRMKMGARDADALSKTFPGFGDPGFEALPD